MSLLEVQNLSKRYGQREAVSGVSFTVGEGETFGILGPNGAGKTTTLSMVCGLIKPTAGKVFIGGHDINAEPAGAKALIGIVPQEPALYGSLSAEANLRFWGTINGLTGRELEAAVEESLKIAGLMERSRERVSHFSGGMKRRLNIAAGFLHRPKLLVMDEPTVGVDPQSRNHILQTVKHLGEEGTSVLYTSHYVEEVEYLCDRVVIIDHGRLIAGGSLGELLEQAGEHQELLMRLDRAPTALDDFAILPGVEKASSAGPLLRLLTRQVEQVLPLALERVTAAGFSVSEIKVVKPNLESLFLKLTGRALRD